MSFKIICLLAPDSERNFQKYYNHDRSCFVSKAAACEEIWFRNILYVRHQAVASVMKDLDEAKGSLERRGAAEKSALSVLLLCIFSVGFAARFAQT